MDYSEYWQSAFTIMAKPLLISNIISRFPMQPSDAFNPGERSFNGETRNFGLCEYRLSPEVDQSSFLATLHAWLDILEPHSEVFHQLHEEEYECFLEIWTSDSHGFFDFSYALLQRVASLGIDLDLHVGTDAQTSAT